MRRFSWGVPVHNEAQVARDVYSFLQKLLRRYPRYRGRPLYVFGESCTYVRVDRCCYAHRIQ